jgi:hypothetical protein
MGFNALAEIQGILGRAGTTVNKDLQMQMAEEQNKQAEMQQIMAKEAEANADLPNAGKEGTTSTSSISADATALLIAGGAGAALAGVAVGLILGALVLAGTIVLAPIAIILIAIAVVLVAAAIALAIFSAVEAAKGAPSDPTKGNDGLTEKGPDVTQYDTGKQTAAQNKVSQLAASVSQAQQQINQIMQQFVNPDQSALQSLENMWTSLNQARQGLVWRG